MARLSSICLVALVALLVACSHKTKPTAATVPKSVNPNASGVAKEKTISQLYDFLETSDKSFCDAALVVATDCGGGNLYFTPKKNVFCVFYCIGSDSVSYLIGKYALTSAGITCTFDREYSFYNPESGKLKNGNPADPNNGRMKKQKSIEFKLNKIKCEKFDFNFNSVGNQKYVLRKSDSKQSDYFFSTFKKIKAFSRL